MRFASAIATHPDPQEALHSALEQVTKALGTQKVDVAFLFVSTLYAANWQPLLHQIRKELGDPLLLGCTAGGVLGVDLEIEGTLALSLVAAQLPQVTLHPFQVSPDDLVESRPKSFWVEKIGVDPSEEPVGVLIPEPFSCDCMRLVAEMGTAYPKIPLVGGLASGAQTASEVALFLNEEVIKHGAVGVLMTGNVALQTIVSQGCRPIGRPYIVTKAQGHTILELAGMPATDALQTLFQSLSPADQHLVQRALLLGVVMNEYKPTFGRGDFLIRSLMGMDPSSGALAVGDHIQVGQTVQFQVRDANSAREDLQNLLEEQRAQLAHAPSAGALLFNCLGRGQALYGEPHYDIRTIRSAVGNLPIGGFFCNGEIGPIAGRNYIHGFTSSLGLFSHRR